MGAVQKKKGGTKMKNTNLIKGLLIGLCVFTLVGCKTNGSSDNDNLKNSNTPVTENQSNSSGKNNGGTEADDLIDSATLMGSVIDFSDKGCSVSQVTSEDGGKSAKVAAPGSENADTTVHIKYESDCIFQIATISITTGKATITNASILDIKKQTSLIIYGDFDNTHNLSATKVLLARYQ